MSVRLGLCCSTQPVISAFEIHVFFKNEILQYSGRKMSFRSIVSPFQMFSLDF